MFPSGLHSDPEMVRVRDGRNHVDQPFSFLAELTVGKDVHHVTMLKRKKCMLAFSKRVVPRDKLSRPLWDERAFFIF